MCKIASCSFNPKLTQLLVPALPNFKPPIPFFYLYFLEKGRFRSSEDLKAPDETELNRTDLDSATTIGGRVLYCHEEEHKQDFSLCTKERQPRRWCFILGKEEERPGKQTANLDRHETPHAIRSSLFGREITFHLWPRWEPIWARGTNEKSWIPC